MPDINWFIVISSSPWNAISTIYVYAYISLFSVSYIKIISAFYFGFLYCNYCCIVVVLLLQTQQANNNINNQNMAALNQQNLNNIAGSTDTILICRALKKVAFFMILKRYVQCLNIYVTKVEN